MGHYRYLLPCLFLRVLHRFGLQLDEPVEGWLLSEQHGQPPEFYLIFPALLSDPYSYGQRIVSLQFQVIP